MSWAKDKAREAAPWSGLASEIWRDRIEAAISETISRVRSEVAEASRDLPAETRIALDAAVKKLDES